MVLWEKSRLRSEVRGVHWMGTFPSNSDGREGSRKEHRDLATESGKVEVTLKQEIAER